MPKNIHKVPKYKLIRLYIGIHLYVYRNVMAMKQARNLKGNRQAYKRVFEDNKGKR